MNSSHRRSQTGRKSPLNEGTVTLEPLDVVFNVRQEHFLTSHVHYRLWQSRFPAPHFHFNIVETLPVKQHCGGPAETSLKKLRDFRGNRSLTFNDLINMFQRYASVARTDSSAS